MMELRLREIKSLSEATQLVISEVRTVSPTTHTHTHSPHILPRARPLPPGEAAEMLRACISRSASRVSLSLLWCQRSPNFPALSQCQRLLLDHKSQFLLHRKWLHSLFHSFPSCFFPQIYPPLLEVPAQYSRPASFPGTPPSQDTPHPWFSLFL